MPRHGLSASLQLLSSAFSGGELAQVHCGIFGDTWLVGALCSLSLSEVELFGDPKGGDPLGVYPRLFWDPELRRRGLYCFRFCKQTSWHYVIVDDFLPFCRTRAEPEPLFSYTTAADGVPQLWMPLIEKAYAKLHGSYFSLWLGLVDDGLEDLTGWPSDKLPISKWQKRR